MNTPLRTLLRIVIIISVLFFAASCNQSNNDIQDQGSSQENENQETIDASVTNDDVTTNVQNTDQSSSDNTSLNNSQQETAPEQNSTSQGNSNPDSSDDPNPTNDDSSSDASLPETPSESLISGVVAPFEKIAFKIEDSIEFTKILYSNSNSTQELLQPSFKNSSDEFVLLAIPISISDVDTYSISNGGNVLGNIDILTNEMSAANSAPGIYSLTVLDSLVSGLTVELSLYVEDALNQKLQGDQDQHLETIVMIQQSLPFFQSLVESLRNSVSEADTTSSKTSDHYANLFSSINLNTLDGLFHHLISRFMTDSTFVQFLLENIQTDLSDNTNEINLIFEATSQYLNSWEAIAGLASLKLYSTTNQLHAEIDTLNTELDVVKVSLFPAIIANELKLHRLNAQRSFISESARLLEKVESESPHETDILMSEALSNLKRISTQLSIQNQ